MPQRKTAAFLLILSASLMMIILLFPVFPALSQTLVTNQTSSSFVISWTTNRPTIGCLVSRRPFLLLCDDNLLSTTHLIRAASLEAERSYPIWIIGGFRPKKLIAQTSPLRPNPPPAPRPVYGIIYAPDGDKLKPARGVLAHLTVGGAKNTLTTRTDDNGSYSFDLANFFDSNYQPFYLSEEGGTLKLQFLGEKLGQTYLEVDAAVASPVPPVILSNQIQKKEFNNNFSKVLGAASRLIAKIADEDKPVKKSTVTSTPKAKAPSPIKQEIQNVQQHIVSPSIQSSPPASPPPQSAPAPTSAPAAPPPSQPRPDQGVDNTPPPVSPPAPVTCARRVLMTQCNSCGTGAELIQTESCGETWTSMGSLAACRTTALCPAPTPAAVEPSPTRPIQPTAAPPPSVVPTPVISLPSQPRPLDGEPSSIPSPLVTFPAGSSTPAIILNIDDSQICTNLPGCYVPESRGCVPVGQTNAGYCCWGINAGTRKLSYPHFEEGLCEESKSTAATGKVSTGFEPSAAPTPGSLCWNGNFAPDGDLVNCPLRPTIRVSPPADNIPTTAITPQPTSSFTREALPPEERKDEEAGDKTCSGGFTEGQNWQSECQDTRRTKYLCSAGSITSSTVFDPSCPGYYQQHIIPQDANLETACSSNQRSVVSKKNLILEIERCQAGTTCVKGQCLSGQPSPQPTQSFNEALVSFFLPEPTKPILPKPTEVIQPPAEQKIDKECSFSSDCPGNQTCVGFKCVSVELRPTPVPVSPTPSPIMPQCPGGYVSGQSWQLNCKGTKREVATCSDGKILTSLAPDSLCLKIAEETDIPFMAPTISPTVGGGITSGCEEETSPLLCGGSTKQLQCWFTARDKFGKCAAGLFCAGKCQEKREIQPSPTPTSTPPILTPTPSVSQSVPAPVPTPVAALPPAAPKESDMRPASTPVAMLSLDSFDIQVNTLIDFIEAAAGKPITIISPGTIEAFNSPYSGERGISGFRLQMLANDENIPLDQLRAEINQNRRDFIIYSAALADVQSRGIQAMTVEDFAPLQQASCFPTCLVSVSPQVKELEDLSPSGISHEILHMIQGVNNPNLTENMRYPDLTFTPYASFIEGFTTLQYGFGKPVYYTSKTDIVTLQGLHPEWRDLISSAGQGDLDSFLILKDAYDNWAKSEDSLFLSSYGLGQTFYETFPGFTGYGVNDLNDPAKANAYFQQSAQGSPSVGGNAGITGGY